jgi:3-hydroxyisobutyrate dehydrogenase
MVNVVSSGADDSWALSNLGPKIVAEDMEPGFMIDLLCKDLRLVEELVQETGLALPGVALAQQFFDQARAEELGRLGTQAMWRVIKKTSNLNV